MVVNLIHIHSLYVLAHFCYGFYDLFSIDLPVNAPAGAWRIRAEINSQVWERGFFVGIDPGETRLASAVLPSSRSVYTGNVANSETATFFATIGKKTKTLENDVDSYYIYKLVLPLVQEESIPQI